MMEAGAVCTGGVLWHRPENWMLNDWFATHAIAGGSYRVTARLPAFEDGDLRPEDLATTLQAARSAGRTVIVKIWGMPRSLTSLPDSVGAELFEENYWKFPPADSLWWRWRELVYHLVTYFSAPGVAVTDTTLFGDTAAHESLGLPGLSYELWNEHNWPGSWMPALGGSWNEGSEEAFYRLYEETSAALDSVLADHPEAEIAGLGVSFRLGQGNHPWGDPFDEGSQPGAVRRLAGFCRRKGLDLYRVSSWVYDYVPNSTSGDVRHPHGTWQEAFREALDDSGFVDTKLNIGEWAMHFSSDLILPPEGEPPLLSGSNINDDNEVGAAFLPVRMMDMRRDAMAADASYFDFTEGSPVDAGSVFPLFKKDSGLYTTSGLYKAATNVFFMVGRLGSLELETTRILPDSIPVADPQNYYVNGYGTGEPGQRVSVLVWYYYDAFEALRPGVAWADSIPYEAIRALADTSLPRLRLTLRLRGLSAFLDPAESLRVRVHLVDRRHGNAWEYRYEIGQILAQLPDSMRKAYIRQTVNGWSFAHGDTLSVALEEIADYEIPWGDSLAQELLLEPYSVALLEAEPAGPPAAAPGPPGPGPRGELRIFPNPSGGGLLWLALPAPPAAVRRPVLEVYDVAGRRILQLPLPQPTEPGHPGDLLRVRLEPLAGGARRMGAGIYFVRASWDPALRGRFLLLR
jgi:hypothetical protein